MRVDYSHLPCKGTTLTRELELFSPNGGAGGREVGGGVRKKKREEKGEGRRKERNPHEREPCLSHGGAGPARGWLLGDARESTGSRVRGRFLLYLGPLLNG